ncbi:MAG: hypothetical protein Q9219_005415 [cf. Caloplaca sp. 3 TL-2023]
MADVSRTTSNLHVSSFPYTPTYRQRLAIAFRNRHGIATLKPVDINNTDDSEHIIKNIKATQNELNATERQAWYLNLLWLRTEVAFAKIVWSVSDTRPHSNKETRVGLEKFERDDLLSEAFRYPAILANDRNLISKRQDLILTQAEELLDLTGQHVIVIHTVGDKGKIARLLLLLLLLSPALGMIVGSFSHRSDVGVAVGASIFALASFLQGLVAWLHR